MPKHKTKGPLTLQGAAQGKQALRTRTEDVSLKVLPLRDPVAAPGGSALVHPGDMQQLLGSSSHDGSAFLQLASGSDCVLHTRSSADVPLGHIQVDEVHAANLRLCAGELYSFSVFVPGAQLAAADDHDDDEAEDDAASSCSDMDTSTNAAAAAVSEDSDSDAGEQQQQPSLLDQFELTDIDVEVRLLPHPAANSNSSSSGPVVQVDARVLTQAFCKQCFGRMLAVNEYVVVSLPDCPPLLLRVTAANTLSVEEQADVLGYHCFRGLFTPDTQVFFTTALGHQLVDQQQQQPCAADTAEQLSQLTLQQQPQHAHSSVHTNGCSADPPLQLQSSGTSSSRSSSRSIQLLHARSRPPAAAPTNIVHVLTSDGEHFPVKKKLLRPCIALTKAVRDSGNSAPTVSVAIGTLTFDRVLIFLEAHALRRRPPRFAVHLLGDLQEAATQLGLRPLEQYCRKLLGRKQAALQMYSFADVQRANASGKVWLILDGMVLDVGRWLPEHPGGAAIIPKQSLDCDCARFFEMYHASKESFLYVQEFYVGELLPSDRPDVPMGGKQPPSQDFLQQLREYTTWRQKMQQAAMARGQEPAAFKSF